MDALLFAMYPFSIDLIMPKNFIDIATERIKAAKNGIL
nr:MAG TPA: hypothetical protein [Caudoviricetes sp.]